MKGCSGGIKWRENCILFRLKFGYLSFGVIFSSFHSFYNILANIEARNKIKDSFKLSMEGAL
jgi:hypothetical protein